MKNKKKSVIVDSLHVLNYQDYKEDSQCKIKVVQNDNNQKFFLVEKEDSKNSYESTKYSFIAKCEKSIELAHPAVIGLEGFSIEKPYLYYQYQKDPKVIDDIQLTPLNIQKMFLGIASGLSYLLSKGYYYENFSAQSIIFDEKSNPKLYDYINFENSNKNFEEDLIVKYVDILNSIIDKKRNLDNKLTLNSDLENLIERSKQKSNLPKLVDFVNFFKDKNYCTNDVIIVNDGLFQQYKSDFEEGEGYLFIGELSGTNNYETIEQICNYFNSKTLKTKYDLIFALNSLPEYYIKLCSKYYEPLKAILYNFFYYDDLSLIFKEWNELAKVNNNFKIYQGLKEQIKTFEDERNKIDYFSEERKIYDQKIDAIRIKSIYYLKKAYESSSDTEVKIELAVQYINGDILPYNLGESYKILEKIKDKEAQAFVNKLKSEIESKKILPKLGEKQQDFLQKAEKGSILHMLYVGFAFYTGFDGFPINRSKSIEYYLKASKKSPHAMFLLGYLYLKGIIFPQNFEEAKNCFLQAARKGYIKAEIVDAYFRRHLWRKYLIECDIDDVFQKYLPSFFSILNDGYIIPQINYSLEKKEEKKLIYKAKLKRTNAENSLLSDRFENYSMFFKIEGEEKPEIFAAKKFKYHHSQKFLLQPIISNKNEKADELLSLANSYFYGINNYPVNYSYALEYFKKAADKKNSEAQWRYALMRNNNVGDIENISDNDTNEYLKKSSESGDITGKLYLALFYKNTNNNTEFEKLIKECNDSNNLDAKYFYGMYLENNEESLDKSIKLYKEAADKGHFDSLIRLINLYSIKIKYSNSEKEEKHRNDIESFQKYLRLSVAILNESLLVRLINFLDEKKIMQIPMY